MDDPTSSASREQDVALASDFAAWLDRRDAEALARVFDATGGKLLLLAAHLAGAESRAGSGGAGGAQAHDLVQATFVAAMARGASWDRSRPLWPWLAGVLHNEARMAARRGRRRREVALDAADDTADSAHGPGAVVESAEAFAAVVRTIDALPLPYRQVLRLRLVHGLRPVEIARTLELPVGTVRSQLHRGLEHLRGSLPAGVAGALAMLLAGDGALLAQVRQRVLEHAAAAGRATTGTLLVGGWWTMHGKSIGVALAVGTLLVCLGLFTGIPVAWIARPSEEPRPALASAPLPPAPDAAGGADVAPPLRRAEEVAATAPEPAWSLTVTVRRPGGAPIAGAAVQVYVAPSGMNVDNVTQGEFGREDVAAGETGADGVFRASLDALRERSELARRTRRLFAIARAADGSQDRSLCELPSGAKPRAALELQVPTETSIVGTVVDARGAPVAGAYVTTWDENDPGAHTGRVPCGADGRFRMEVDAERWPVALVAMHPASGMVRRSAPPRPATDDGGAIDVGALVLDDRVACRGRVLLGDGSPLAHVPVHLTELAAAEPPGAPPVDAARVDAVLETPDARLRPLAMRGERVVQRYAQTNLAADGTFRFAGLDPDAVYAVWVLRPDRRRVAAVARPGDDVTLRLDLQLLTIEARDERSDLLPGVRLHAEGYDPSLAHAAPRQRPGFPDRGYVVGNPPFCVTPDGRMQLLSPFGWVWRLATVDDAAQPLAVRHDVVAGVHRATCTLALRSETAVGSLHLAAVDERGAPLENWGFRLRARDRDLEHNFDRAVLPPEGWTMALPAGRWHLHVLLGKEVAPNFRAEGYARGFRDQEIVIEAGRTTNVCVEAPPAGQVAFRLRAATPPAKRWPNLRIESAGVVVDVLAHEREPFLPDPESRSPLPVMFVTKQALPPGAHMFVVTADGHQPVTCRADVKADELTRVSVEMFRQ